MFRSTFTMFDAVQMRSVPLQDQLPQMWTLLQPKRPGKTLQTCPQQHPGLQPPPQPSKPARMRMGQGLKTGPLLAVSNSQSLPLPLMLLQVHQTRPTANAASLAWALINLGQLLNASGRLSRTRHCQNSHRALMG